MGRGVLPKHWRSKLVGEIGWAARASHTGRPLYRFLSRRCHHLSSRECASGTKSGARMRLKPFGCHFERGTGMPAKLPGCRPLRLLPTVPACRTAFEICLPNGEPRTGPSTASSLERDSLLLTRPIAGATRFAFASLSFGSSGNLVAAIDSRETLRKSALAVTGE